MRAACQRVPLFDGKSLAGWEGNTDVWRVRDGVIVGGSLNGNPRNEFLATVKGFKNFAVSVGLAVLCHNLVMLTRL
mgnify:CR=1 FL=1